MPDITLLSVVAATTTIEHASLILGLLLGFATSFAILANIHYHMRRRWDVATIEAAKRNLERAKSGRPISTQDLEDSHTLMAAAVAPAPELYAQLQERNSKPKRLNRFKFWKS